MLTLATQVVASLLFFWGGGGGGHVKKQKSKMREIVPENNFAKRQEFRAHLQLAG